MHTRPATADEYESYCADTAHALIIAEQDGRLAGWCEFAGNTIYLIESYARGAGSAILAALPEITIAYFVCAGSEGFWTKQGFAPITNSRDWARA